jgi:hypothetical protein
MHLAPAIIMDICGLGRIDSHPKKRLKKGVKPMQPTKFTEDE